MISRRSLLVATVLLASCATSGTYKAVATLRVGATAYDTVTTLHSTRLTPTEKAAAAIVIAAATAYSLRRAAIEDRHGGRRYVTINLISSAVHAGHGIAMGMRW